MQGQLPITSILQSIGLNATPSFVFLVNGKQPLEIIGAQPYTVFENTINHIMA